jgi:hypothetical protein
MTLMRNKRLGYTSVGIYACKESDAPHIAVTQFKSLHESDPTIDPNNLCFIHAYWRGIMHKLDDPAINLTVFKAIYGIECAGFAFAMANFLPDDELKEFDGEIRLIRVLKKAQRNRVGKRLLACVAANLYSFGLRNAFIVVENDDIDYLNFVKAMNARLVCYRENSVVFAWDDLIPILMPDVNNG